MASTDLSDILPEDVEEKVKEAAEISMGTEISEEDILNIQSLCDEVLAINDYRTHLSDYLKARMLAMAPNLTVLVGETIGARLIAHAGSLVNLAKHPASTVQILGKITTHCQFAKSNYFTDDSEGLVSLKKFPMKQTRKCFWLQQPWLSDIFARAKRILSHVEKNNPKLIHPKSFVSISLNAGAEKALFRALKTKKDTPKYGLIYHAQMIGSASLKNKGKMARSLAAKASLATRLDAFGEDTDYELGVEHKAKLEARLRLLEEGNLHRLSGTGKAKAKLEKYHVKSTVLSYPSEADSTLPTTSGKAKKRKLIEEINEEDDAETTVEVKEEDGEGKKKKKKKKDKQKDAEAEEAAAAVEPPKKKVKHEVVEEMDVTVEGDEPSGEKKKKKKKKKNKEESD